MEVHAAPAVGKRMWRYLRAAFLMMRKGVLSNKRKLLVSMHIHLLLLKKRSRDYKAVARTVATLLSSHRAHHDSNDMHSAHALRRHGYDYDFSCTNTNTTPAPADASSSSSSSCLGAVAEYAYVSGSGPLSLPDADASSTPAPPLAGRIEYYYYAAAVASPAPSSPGGLLAPGEEYYEYQYQYQYDDCAPSPSPSPALLPGSGGSFSVRVSNYSSEGDEGGAGDGGEAVDDAAEEFIRRFYDQLRRQNAAVALLPNMHGDSIISAA